MKPRTLTATTPDGTFTRKTAHDYKFVVLVGGWAESRIREQESGERASLVEQLAFQAQLKAALVDGKVEYHFWCNRFGWGKSPSGHSIVHTAAEVQKSADELLARLAALTPEKLAARIASGQKIDRLGVFQWTSRRDLATKAASQAHSRGYLKVAVHPVDQEG